MLPDLQVREMKGIVMFAGWFNGRLSDVAELGCERWTIFGKIKPDGSELFLAMDQKEYADFEARSESQQARVVARIRKYLQAFRGKLPIVKDLNFFVDSRRAHGNRSR